MQKQPLLVNNILDYAVSLRSVMHPSDMFHMAWTAPCLPWLPHFMSGMHAGQISCRAAGTTAVMHDHSAELLTQQQGRCSASSLVQIISVTVEGGEHICTYHDMHRRSQLMALALQKLGVK